MQNFFTNLSLYPYTFAVGLSLAVACSLLSVFIVLRRMAMISEAIAHSGIGGIAVALLLGVYWPIFNHPLMIQLVTGIFCLVTALLIGYVAKGGHVTEDSAIGIFLTATLALGIFLLSVRSKLPILSGQPRPASIEQILFGDIISVTRDEAWTAFGAMIVVVLVVLALYNELVYATLDEEMARINGVNTALIRTIQLCLISLVIVVGVRMVGGLMITALTVIPGATARMLSRRFNGVLIASVLIGCFGIGAGLVVAVNPPLFRYTSGPILVLTLFVIFAAVWLLHKFAKPRAEHTHGGAPEGAEVLPAQQEGVR